MVVLKPLNFTMYLTGDSTYAQLKVKVHNPNRTGYAQFTAWSATAVYKGAEASLRMPESIQGAKIPAGASSETWLAYDIQNMRHAEFFKINITYKIYPYSEEVSPFNSVAQLIENSKTIKWAPTEFLPKNLPDVVYLKVFGEFPKTSDAYIAWETSSDGVNWKPYSYPFFRDGTATNSLKAVTVYDLKPKLQSTSASTGILSEDDMYEVNAYKLTGINSPLDKTSVRPDIIAFIQNADVGHGGSGTISAHMCIRARIFNTASVEYQYKNSSGQTHTAYRPLVSTVLGTITYYPIQDNSDEALYTEISQASKGNNFRYNTSNYAYGISDFKNFIIPSLPGDTVRPISKLIELNTNENTIVTNLVAWRDYLMAFTEHSVHLIQFEEGNAFVKTIHTDIGIPKVDARCCKAILNGVVFKSGQSVYLIYPNMYSGTDVVTNVTDISEAISEYLVEYDSSEDYTPFAITSDSEYILFLPKENSTFCLKYDYINKRWTSLEYPVEIYDYEIFEQSDIRVFGKAKLDDGTFKYVEYSINSDFSDIFDNIPENLPYADFLTESVNGIADDVEHWGTVDYVGKISPIKFLLDSGQKTNSRWDTKQFSESKIVVSTLHSKDTFPMTLTVHVDGTVFKHKIDLNTDAAFIREPLDIGTLSTSVANSTSDDFNTYRKMFVRYSGKGMSIRHIIEGESVYPFKLYDILYRFKELNIKR